MTDDGRQLDVSCCQPVACLGPLGTLLGVFAFDLLPCGQKFSEAWRQEDLPVRTDADARR